MDDNREKEEDQGRGRNKEVEKTGLKRGWGLPGGPVDKNSPANAVDTGSFPGLGRFHMLQSN